MTATPLADLVRLLAANGLPMEAIAEAVSLAEQATTRASGPVVMKDEAAERRREQDRNRKAQMRNGLRNSAEICGQSADTPARDKVYIINNTPPQNPTGSSAPQGATRVRGHRLPADWKPTAELHAYAIGQGVPNHHLARMDADFCGHFHTATGPNSRKLDWGLAYQGWARREADKFKAKATDPPKRVWGSV